MTREDILNIGSHVVQFHAVLICDDISFSGSCISSQNNTVFENKTGDCCSSFDGFGSRKSFIGQKFIPDKWRVQDYKVNTQNSFRYALKSVS